MTAHQLVSRMKEKNERTRLRTYKEHVKKVASEIASKKVASRQAVNTSKTFSGDRRYIRYLRKLGFTVVLRKMTRWKCVYFLEYDITL